MGKLIATTQATVDGVVDPVGEWVQADGDHGEYSFERQARSGGLVLGRKTYEGLAGYWPSQSGKWADMVNAMPKYVGSTTLSGDLEWNATLLEGELEESIPKLKDEVDGDLFMHGSGEFAYALAEKGLIDEYEVYLNPLVWGKGNVHVLGDRGTVRMELERREAVRLRRGPAHLSPGVLTEPTAEGVGFEPTDRRTRSTAFKAAAFNRSATPPGTASAPRLSKRPKSDSIRSHRWRRVGPTGQATSTASRLRSSGRRP